MVTLADGAGVAAHPLWHLAAVIVAPPAIIVALTVRDRLRYRRGPGARRARWWQSLDSRAVPIAAASGGAAVVHGLVSPEHFQEQTVYGVFFLVLCVLQVGWAAAVLRRASALLLGAGAIVNALVVLLWLDTRTVGLPLGPDRFRPEAVGQLDLLATALEIIAVMLALRLRRQVAAAPVGRRQARHVGRPA